MPGIILEKHSEYIHIFVSIKKFNIFLRENKLHFPKNMNTFKIE